jgi:hypothetical protein
MTTYSITDLGTLQGDYPLPYAINNAGVVAGRLLNNLPCRYKNGALLELTVPSLVNSGIGRGISPSHPERIVGWVYQPGGGDRATMWTNGVYTDLHPFIGAAFTEAYDVNDSGVVTGQANGKGFRLDTTTQQVELLELSNGDVVFPTAINASGHVVGNSGTPEVSGQRLFFCDQTIHVIPTPGNVPFETIDVNDADVIASHCSGHAFTYDFKSKVFTDIHGAAFTSSSVQCINNQGAVVGACSDASGTHAMIWTASDGMRRLIDLVDMQSGWTFSGAYAINDAEEITGRGIHNGQPRGFLLTPVEKDSKRQPKDLVAMVNEILLAGGGMGILLPSGDIIYPKDGPVDPDSPLQRLDAARSDAAVGLAMQVLARRISDRSTRALAEKAAAEITRSAAASAGSAKADAGRSNWLSRLVRDIADELER